LKPSDRGQVEAARSAYEALTASRKALVTRLGELTAAEAKIVDLQAEADAAVFKETHAGVLAKTVDNIAISDKADVAAALAVYELLSSEAKAKLTDGEKVLLDSLKVKIEDLEAEELAAAKTFAATLTEEDYTTASWTALATALALPETTNAEVVAKTATINDAIADLVFAGQADLDIAKTAAGKLTSSNYTAASWSALTAALALTETTNAEIVAKTTAINNAIAGLKAITIPGPIGPIGPPPVQPKPPTQTIEASSGNNTVQIPVETSEGAAKLQLNKEIVNELVEVGKDEDRIVIELSKVSDITAAIIPMEESIFNKFETLAVSLPAASISFDRSAQKTIAEAAGEEEIRIVAKKEHEPVLTKEQKEKIGDGEVYRFSVLAGDKPISDFKGKVTVSIPYTLKEGESPEGIRIWYINDAGEITEVECSYNPQTGLVTFTTDHFSYYALTYEKIAIWVNPYKDIQEDNWYYEAVFFVTKEGLFNGVKPDMFDPNGNTTRAMFVTVLGRLAGVDISLYKGKSFKDVVEGSWYAPYVKWASENKIVLGYDGETFGTDDFITREQMATMMLRYIRVMGITVSNTGGTSKPFSDEEKVSGYAKEAVEIMRITGLIKGMDNNMFAPQNYATRAEAATIMMRLAKIGQQQEK
jgi:hypothetical protein